jgi:hypothetical protein
MPHCWTHLGDFSDVEYEKDSLLAPRKENIKEGQQSENQLCLIVDSEPR